MTARETIQARTQMLREVYEDHHGEAGNPAQHMTFHEWADWFVNTNPITGERWGNDDPFTGQPRIAAAS